MVILRPARTAVTDYEKACRSKLLGSSAMIVLSNSAKPFVTFDLVRDRDNFIVWVNDLVIEALMISFFVIMLHKRTDSSTK